MQSKKYFCYEIYKNLAVWSFNGKISYNPCSKFDGYIKQSDKFDINEIWNSPEHWQLKNLVESDQLVPQCHRCYEEEAAGLTSRRLGSKQLYEEYHNDTNLDLNGPQSIDYSVGNLCNLKCVICGPDNSTAWFDDYRTIFPAEDMQKFKYDKHNQIEINDPAVLKNITNIHFHGGGEPLLSDNHINLLKQIKNFKGLSDLRIYYNTNGTTTVTTDVLDLWAECQLVELYFSIDDIGPRFDYQRTGGSWDKVLKNLQWFKQHMPVNHMFNINCSWGYLNIYHLNDLVDWYHNNFNSNRLGDPINLIFQKVIGPYSINHVSIELKNNLIEKFTNYPMLLELVHTLNESSNDHSIFWQHINRLDAVRGTNFAIVCPKFATLLT
jgi:MoaA/NifB/PqqE/SkfB family radical SAM enzyme